MQRLEFIRSGLTFNLLVADEVSDILPMLLKAVEAFPEEAKQMPPVLAGRL
jgi:hypothetical protein